MGESPKLAQCYAGNAICPAPQPTAAWPSCVAVPQPHQPACAPHHAARPTLRSGSMKALYMGYTVSEIWRGQCRPARGEAISSTERRHSAAPGARLPQPQANHGTSLATHICYVLCRVQHTCPRTCWMISSGAWPERLMSRSTRLTRSKCTPPVMDTRRSSCRAGAPRGKGGLVA